MAKLTSKADLLFMINDLIEQGDFESAAKLQKIFISSIESDRKSGKFSAEVKLDRSDKKAFSYAEQKLSLAT